MNFEPGQASTMQKTHKPTPSLFPPLKRTLAGISIVLLTLCTASLAEETDNAEKTEAPPSRITPNHEALRQSALSAEVQPSDLVWLDITYPGQSEPVQILGLQQEPRTPDAQGAVLILPDKGQHADWPGLARQLRSELPDSGWYTLAVSLPLEQPSAALERTQGAKQNDEINLTATLKSSLAKPPKRQQTSEQDPLAQTNAGETDSPKEGDTGTENVDIDLEEAKAGKEEAPGYDERALVHLKAAMDHATSKGYRNIILIAIGSSSELALQYIKPMANEFTQQGFALILVDAQLSPAFNENIGEALGEEFQAPVLDIVNGAQRDKLALYSRRQQMAKASQIRAYQQLELAAVNPAQQHKTLLKRIDSWLKVHAPGMAAKTVRR